MSYLVVPGAFAPKCPKYAKGELPTNVHSISYCKCNFNCEFCFFKYYKDTNKYIDYSEEQFERLVRELLPSGNMFKFTGGEPTLNSDLELNRIKDQLDLQAERSIYLYQNIPELPLEEYEKEETYCERQRILGRIMILATMDKFHYPIDEINSYIDNIESIIIDSKRISESDKQNYLTNLPDKYIEHTDKKGCYVATAVYGSYDCPEVWTLRRFRDEFLNKRRLGRLLVKIYYKISPRLILTFGSIKLIKNINRKILDKIVRKLNGRGYVNSKYIDQ